MNRIFRAILLSAALAGVFSCGKSDEDLYKLNVKEEVTVVTGADIAFKAIGGDGYIVVSSQNLHGNLVATTQSASWCHLSVEGNRIKVVVDEYTGLESRYAVVEMKAGEAEGKTIVHQFGVIVKEFAPFDLTFRNGASRKAFFYDANETVVQASVDADWLRLDNTTYPDSLVVSVLDNPGKEYREAEVHWSIGEMKGSFFVSQFDLADAGLLGDWTFHAVNASNGRAFSYYPLNAVLTENAGGTYDLAITKQSGNVVVDYLISGLTLERNRLMIPLGKHVGTHKPNANNTYQVFPLLAAGTSATTYANAVTTGSYPLVIGKDHETGEWRAEADPSAFGDLVFRFEFWTDKSHNGTSNSRTALKDIYMVKD